jgi:hypothetical protein
MIFPSPFCKNRPNPLFRNPQLRFQTTLLHKNPKPVLQLRMRRPEELRGRLVVHFQGEEGIDAGGLTREWYQLLSRVIFDKGTLLFTSAQGNDSTFQPNPNSAYQTEHLSYFKFVGRVVSGIDCGLKISCYSNSRMIVRFWSGGESWKAFTILSIGLGQPALSTNQEQVRTSPDNRLRQYRTSYCSVLHSRLRSWVGILVNLQP